MAYVALYRSYRPNSFKEVVGQKHVVQTLKNAVMENKTSHAYIFSGLRGIGKTTIARILAKAVNCENPEGGEPCNTCKNCLSIINDETTDIVELDAASNNGVDEMRNILEKVNFLPSMLRKKVYIIDEAHMLSTAAFNALLKTLEEPPVHVIFILATTEPHKIPATILSRCQRFDFKQFTVKELKEEIDYVCHKENIKITKEAMYAIAEAADGGMRDALSILDQANVFAEDEITIDDVDSVTGRISNYKLIDLLTALKTRNATKSIYIINELINMGKEVNRLVSGIIQFCRDILLYKNSINITNRYIYKNEDFINLVNNITPNELFYYIDILVDVQNKIRYTNSQKIYLEVGIIKIINTIDENLDLLSKIHKLEENMGTASGDSTYNNEYDNRFNMLDNRIRKVSNDLERAKLDEFKEKMESKMELLEEVSSKNAAMPVDLGFRLDSLEDKIRVLNSENNTGNSDEIKQINEKFVQLEEKIQNMGIAPTAIENSDSQINDAQTLKQQLELLEEKVQKLVENNTNNALIIPTNTNDELRQKVEFIEEYINNFASKIDNVDINNTNNVANEDLINEINELKENYFLVIKALQDTNNNKNVNNNEFDYAAELGFLDEEEPKTTSKTNDVSFMIDELVANVNRISTKLQENNESIDKINDEITSLNNKDNELNLLITANQNDINEIKNSDITNELNEKITTVNEKVNALESKQEELKQEISKVKQVSTIVKPVEPIQKVETKPVTPEVKPVVKEEYVRPVEEKRVVEVNESKTLETHKNVYDVKIIERILHEARSMECREDKVKLNNGWSKLEDKVGYALSPVAKMLRDGKLAANGRNELLIIYPSATMCNHLMEPKNYTDAKQVLRITFGKDYDYLALPENTWQEKRSEYIGQYGIGVKYPKLTPINNPELKVVTVNYNQINTNQKRPLQQAKAFFGSSIVEEENNE